MFGDFWAAANDLLLVVLDLPLVALDLPSRGSLSTWLAPKDPQVDQEPREVDQEPREVDQEP